MKTRWKTLALSAACLLVATSACTSTGGPPASVAGQASAPSTTISATSTSTSQTAASAAASTAAPAEFDPRNLNLDAGGGFVSLDDPVMIPASSATWLEPDDVVLGIVTPSGTPQAFPVRQMAYHHIANTTIDGEPYLVTY